MELEWLRTLPNMILTDHLLFVHAGVQPGTRRWSSKIASVLWIPRRSTRQEPSFRDRFCIVGHWPVVLYQHEGRNASPILEIKSGKSILSDGLQQCAEAGWAVELSRL